MIKLEAIRYDGKTSAQQSVLLQLVDDIIYVTAPDLNQVYSAADTELTPHLGRLKTQLRFIDGSICEFERNPEIDHALEGFKQSKIEGAAFRLESRLRYIALAVLLTLVTVFALIQFGIPKAAEWIAYRIPIELEAELGEESLAFFSKYMCTESKLDLQRQDALRQQWLARMGYKTLAPAAIHFCNSAQIGPNAFALPGGHIIFTDQLINLAKDDRELLGVFAHELGHVRKRHALRHILQDSATALIMVLITGDIGTISSLSASIPTLLIQTKFSRRFESEADDFAMGFVERQQISAGYLADILQRMEETINSKESSPNSFISTHPLTVQRLKKLRDYHTACLQNRSSDTEGEQPVCGSLPTL